MKAYLVIDENGIVQNVGLWDGTSPWELPDGWAVVEPNEGEYYEIGKPRGVAMPKQAEKTKGKRHGS